MSVVVVVVMFVVAVVSSGGGVRWCKVVVIGNACSRWKR